MARLVLMQYVSRLNGMTDGLVLTFGGQIAETYWGLHVQHRSAFTHEIDIRPYAEKF